MPAPHILNGSGLGLSRHFMFRAALVAFACGHCLPVGWVGGPLPIDWGAMRERLIENLRVFHGVSPALSSPPAEHEAPAVHINRGIKPTPHPVNRPILSLAVVRVVCGQWPLSPNHTHICRAGHAYPCNHAHAAGRVLSSFIPALLSHTLHAVALFRLAVYPCPSAVLSTVTGKGESTLGGEGKSGWKGARWWDG